MIEEYSNNKGSAENMEKVICRAVGEKEGNVQSFLDEIHASGWLGAGRKTIVIKPNLCTLASVESGIISDISFIRNLIRFLKLKLPGNKIKIIESDSFDRSAAEAYGKLGYTELASEEGVELVNLTEIKSISIVVRDVPYEIKLPDIFLDEIFFISIGNLKTHDYQKITCIFKNQFGCLPDLLKERYHPYLDEILYHLDCFTNPDLSIVDGRIALEGNGPVDGEPIKCGAMIAGKSSIAVDTVCARMAGFDPESVPYLRHAYRKTHFDKNAIEIVGETLKFNFKFIPEKLFKGIRLKISIVRVSNLITNFAKKGLFHIYYFGFIATARMVPKFITKRMKKA